MAEFKYHTDCTSCGSSDACAIYTDDSKHCFSCGYTKPSDEYIEANKDKKNKGKTKLEKTLEEAPTKSTDRKEKPIVTEEQTAELKSRTSVKAPTYRGIRSDTLATFGVRTEFNESTGAPCAVYYPCTQDNQLTGWKPRKFPKDFGGSIGRTGATCQLFGQFKFTRPAKVVLLVGGENDCLSAYQMLQDYIKSKGNDYEISVVSPTIGETGCAKQLAAQYAWFDMHDKIIIGFDNDKAGKEATESAVDVLPKGKIFIANWKYKDPNEYLEKGQDKAFLSDYFNAKAYVPAGVLGSSELYDKMMEQASRKSIPLPPFLSKLESMLGQWTLGTIGVMAAGTGAAKTTIANEIIYHLLFESPYRTGIVSLELDGGQYAQALLSRHINNKISSIIVPEDKISYLNSEAIKLKSDELFKTESGADRFILLDEREFSMEVMQKKIIEMIVSTGCQVIVLDPVSDLFDGLPHEEQASFMRFLKSTVKSYNCSFLLLAHIRKSSDNKSAASSGNFVPEEAIFGSGSLTKSASWVVLLSRDKYNEDDIIRNTTNVVLSKNRSGSITGKAGDIYYCSKTHRMYDLQDYMNSTKGGQSF